MMLCTVVLLLCFDWLLSSAAAQAPLHEEIDRLIIAGAGGPVAAVADDAEFLRRVSLDLAGIVPTADETRKFLADADAAKRTKLIDRLLAAPQYARRMQEAWSVMLLERRVGTAVPDAQWSAYLKQSFEQSKPWNQLAREVLGGDGRDEASRAAIKFFVDGGRIEQHQTTRDVARLFLGMDVQCAQCHDHPTIDDYKQADYYGLFAALSNGKLQNAGGKAYFVEQPLTKKVEFQSVFIPDQKHQTGPRLPGGKEVEIPQFEKGQDLAEPAAGGLPGVLKFRPRATLAEQLAAADSPRFVRNSVNRFWFLMMGRGLVHPLDLMHKANPPSHPELLDMLANHFVEQKFDVKWLLREMALSQTYQRSSLLPAGVASTDAPPQSYRAAVPKALSPEQLAWSVMQASGNLEAFVAAPTPEGSKFTYFDYVNGRIQQPPGNLPDAMALFVGVFGNPPGEAEVDFSSSVGHSLFLMNERLVLDWLRPKPGNLVERLSKITDAGQVADELYLSVLTRTPSADERAEVTEYLTRYATRRQEALGELAWALLASAEFRLNH